MSEAYGQQQVRTGAASGPRAGFWQRFGAAFLDGIIVAIAEFILLAILGKSLGYLVSFIGSYAYYTFLEGGPRGQTIGKMALGIRVVDFNSGGPIGYGRGLLRQLGKLVSGIVILLGYLWMLWDAEKQTWHDKIATTVVVPLSAYPIE